MCKDPEARNICVLKEGKGDRCDWDIVTEKASGSRSQRGSGGITKHLLVMLSIFVIVQGKWNHQRYFRGSSIQENGHEGVGRQRGHGSGCEGWRRKGRKGLLPRGWQEAGALCPTVTRSPIPTQQVSKPGQNF